jgi:hypothetical protein
MRTEDKNKNDSTLLGLNKLYVVDYEGNYYINSPAIMATDKTIKRNNTDLLIIHPDKNSKMYPVILLDAYFEDGLVHLNVQDIRTQKKFTIDHCIQCPENRCKWVLIDLDYVNNLLDYETIKSYCGKCAANNKKTVARSNYKDGNNDLLEFEF